MDVICFRCQVVIQPGMPYDSHIHDRASGPPYTTSSHRNAEDVCRPRATRKLTKANGLKLTQHSST